METYLLILGMGLACFAPRYLPLVLFGERDFPKAWQTALGYIPPAVLAAVVVPSVLMPTGVRLDLDWTNPYLLAGVFTFALGLLVKRFLLVSTVGVTVFALLTVFVVPETAGFDAAKTKIVNASSQTGGVLRFAQVDDFDSLDPGNTYYTANWDFFRFFGRSLVTYRPAPGKDGLTLVPDLAESLGEASPDARTWTYRLRQGIRFDDGREITSKDVKYAIERSYASDVLTIGPTYFKRLLGTDYPGPYKDPHPERLGLTAIETPDDRTLVFRLRQPFADFDFVATLPQTVPVPRDKDTGGEYWRRPVASGPYMVERYERGKSLVLVPNPHWDKATDPVRHQRASRVEVRLKVDPADLDNLVISGDAHVDQAGTGFQQVTQALAMHNPNLKRDADNPLTGFLRYVSIQTAVAPFDNVHCRRAVQYAMDKAGMRNGYGGDVSGGDLASTVLPPTVLGHQLYDRYPNGADRTGDVARGREELALCGKPDGFSTTIVHRSNRPKERQAAEALRTSLARIGITTDIKDYPPSEFFTTYGGRPDFVRANNLGLILMGFGPDWPSGYGFLQPIVDGRAIKESGNLNLAELNDPTVNSMIDTASATLDPERRTRMWHEVDKAVMETAVIAPVVYEKTLIYRNPELTNVYVHPAYGMYDYVSLGIG
ncbi:MAG TPA: ABC transporter substrate-binding protein [Pseudonocardiaceae bacterium]